MPTKKDAEELVRERKRQAGRKHYANNKEKVKAYIRAYKDRKRKAWREYKKTLSCARCGACHPAIIDFHHVDREDPDKKKVHQLVKEQKFAQAHEEIKKCLILCANCHRILHWEEKHKEDEV